MDLRRDISGEKILLFHQVRMHDTSMICVYIHAFVCYLFEIVAWGIRASASGVGANPTLIGFPQPMDAGEHANGIWEMSAGRWG